MEPKRGRGMGSKDNVGRKPKPAGMKRINRSISANDVEWAWVLNLAARWKCSIPDAILFAVAESLLNADRNE